MIDRAELPLGIGWPGRGGIDQVVDLLGVRPVDEKRRLVGMRTDARSHRAAPIAIPTIRIIRYRS
ncbi:MAG: hypothetical protein ABSC94_28215 [Polyangiaceae bacterium]